MGKPFSSDLRERVAAHMAAGQSCRDAARRFGIAPSTAVRLGQRVAATGSTAPARMGRPPGGGKLADHMAQLIAWIEAEPDITMPELCAKLAAAKGVTVHPASLSRGLIKAGLRYKKKPAGRGNRAREDQGRS